MNIKITPDEEIIFNMILDSNIPNITPRVAGGWVRDKLMLLDSYDMDIALDNITGYEFAKHLEAMHKDSVSKISIIQSNPEKSKHLETAVCKINNIMVDFVNLRCETYTDSRIPQIRIGTVKEDAYRRDLTINALYYNIKTKEIEDHTGYGLLDIQNKILRTPLDSLVTFLEDPLRILRVFRFKAKFQFSIINDIREALTNMNLRNCLKEKVSKERIHIELFKMLEYTNGYLGIEEIIRNKYADIILEYAVDYKNLEEIYNFVISPILSASQKVSVKNIEWHEYQISGEKYLLQNGCLDTFTLVNMDHQWVLHFGCENIEINIRNTSRNLKFIFSIYLLILPSSGLSVKKKTKREFQNVIILRESLMCSRKTCSLINEIEQGLYNMNLLDLTDHSDYNLLFIASILGTHFFEIMLLHYCKVRDTSVVRLLKRILINRMSSLKHKKPIIHIPDLCTSLSILKYQIKYFIMECVIAQELNKDFSAEDMILYLKTNKLTIIKRFERFDPALRK